MDAVTTGQHQLWTSDLASEFTRRERLPAWY
eukprot:SAG31_NODE_40183_length_282_cov_1.136612_1_plen_30_part_10